MSNTCISEIPEGWVKKEWLRKTFWKNNNLNLLKFGKNKDINLQIQNSANYKQDK